MGGISVLFSMGLLGGIYALFFASIVIFIAIIIYSIIAYIFESIAMMGISRGLRRRAPIAAWIPFYQKYLAGSIAGSKTVGGLSAFFHLGALCTGVYCRYCSQNVLSFFSLFLLCLLAGLILDLMVAHRLYKRASPKYGDILTVCSVLTLGILRPILLFVIRNKVSEPAGTEEA